VQRTVVRGMYAAFAKGDVSAILAALDPQVQWWEAENLRYADGNPCIDPDAVFESVLMRIGREWGGYTASPHDVLDAGETVIGYGYYSGTSTRTGQQIWAQFAHFFCFRAGKVVHFQQYTDTAQFRQAVAG
jgi:ketosteroid isomerase-like protein